MLLLLLLSLLRAESVAPACPPLATTAYRRPLTRRGARRVPGSVPGHGDKYCADCGLNCGHRADGGERFGGPSGRDQAWTSAFSQAPLPRLQTFPKLLFPYDNNPHRCVLSL